MVDNSKWSGQLPPHWIGLPSSSTPLLRCELVATMNLTLKVEDFVWEPFFFVVPAFVVPCCFNERVPCRRPRMARSTRRSKPDQRGAETLGGLPARLHAIRKVGFDQLVRENASAKAPGRVLACSPWRDLKKHARGKQCVQAGVKTFTCIHGPCPV